jgi:hypothetical protein
MSVCRTYPVRGMCDALGLCFDEPFSRVGTATTAVCENAASMSMSTTSADNVIFLALIHARWTVYRSGHSPMASICRWRSVVTMHRQPHPSPSLFQSGSQSSTSLHDFITNSEAQPPSRHELWHCMLFWCSLHQSRPVQPRELKRFNTAHETRAAI